MADLHQHPSDEVKRIHRREKPLQSNSPSDSETLVNEESKYSLKYPRGRINFFSLTVVFLSLSRRNSRHLQSMRLREEASGSFDRSSYLQNNYVFFQYTKGFSPSRLVSMLSLTSPLLLTTVRCGKFSSFINRYRAMFSNGHRARQAPEPNRSSH